MPLYGQALPLTGSGQTVTASTPLINLTQTWNAGGVAFEAILVNVTSNASSSGSILMRLQVGSADKHRFYRDGEYILAGSISAGTSITAATYVKTTGKAVASLVSAATAGAGARDFVTDALTTLALGLGTTVAGGGSNKVPVHSDGTNWIYG